MSTVTVTRNAGLIVITRTDDLGQETATGHDFCASAEDTDGLALAKLFAGSQALLDGLKTAADMLEGEGYDVAAFRESIADAETVVDDEEGEPE